MANYVTWARNTSDKQTYTILNDALTRWKTEGGNVGVLTVGTPVGEVLRYMLSPITLAGNMSHTCLRPGSTYPAKSIVAAGNHAQYYFAQYNSYNDGTVALGTPTSQYPYGQGVCYLANDGSSDYNFGVTSTTGWIAVKAGNSTLISDGSMGGDWVPGGYASITFWSCIGSGPTPAAPSGTITQIDVTGEQVADFGGCNLTGINVSGLTSLNYLDVSGNASITGSVGTLNSLYSGLPTTTNGQLFVNDDSLAATGSDTVIAVAKGWSCDAPSPGTPSAASYPGTGGAIMGNGGAQAYSPCILTTTGFVAYQPQGGSAVMAPASANITIPACNFLTVWSVDANGKASGNILQLNCSSTKLTSLDVSKCTGLYSLVCCFNNQLTSLDVSGLTSLTGVNCSANQLTLVNASGCTSLTSFYCQNNNLGTINVSGDSQLPLHSTNGSTLFQVQGNPSVSFIGQ